MLTGRLFQMSGPQTEKARRPNWVLVLQYLMAMLSSLASYGIGSPAAITMAV